MLDTGQVPVSISVLLDTTTAVTLETLHKLSTPRRYSMMTVFRRHDTFLFLADNISTDFCKAASFLSAGFPKTAEQGFFSKVRSIGTTETSTK